MANPVELLGASLKSGAKVNLTFTAQEMKETFSEMLSIAPGGGGYFPVVGERAYVDPGEAYKYGLASLRNFSTSYNLNMPDDVLKYVAGAGGGAGLDTTVPTIGMLNTVLSQVSATDFVENVGATIDPKNFVSGAKGIGFVTPQMAKAGLQSVAGDALGVASAEITKAMGQGVGTMVGGAVGGAIGGIFGPVGAAIGGLLGSLFGSLFNPAPKTPFEGPYAEDWANLQKFQKIADRMLEHRLKMVDACKANEEEYWNILDEFMYEFGKEWMIKEREIGFKFNLRWFEDTTGPAYYKTPTSLVRAGARMGVTYKGTKNYMGQSSYYSYAHKVGDKEIVKTACTFPMAGCPYPTMSGVKLPYPGTNSFGPGGRFRLPSGRREAAALAARDIIWTPKSARLDCNALFPHPTSRELLQGKSAEEAYSAHTHEMDASLRAKHAALTEGTTYLIADLARTAVATKTHLRTMARRQEYRAAGVSLKDLLEIEQATDHKHDLFNNVAMYGGLGVLALALYGAVRR